MPSPTLYLFTLPMAALCLLGTIFGGSSAFAQQPGALQPFLSPTIRARSAEDPNGVLPRFAPFRAESASSDFSRPRREAVDFTLGSPSAGGPTVTGSRAVIRRGLAYAPESAPLNVKRAIWALNRIVGRPYKWGGGHDSFQDSGYDCSGTVSYALHHAGLLEAPMPSAEFTRFGDRGRGRWITVYARHGHVFAVIAGLRLDTTDFRYGGDVGPRWHDDGRDTFGFEARHAAGA